MGNGKKKKIKALNEFADGGRAILVGAASLLPQRAAASRVRISAAACMLAIKGITELLKQAVPERRPDDEDNESFPSEHAAECTAAAIIIEREYPGTIGSLAFALATAVSLSRIQSGKHYPRDVFTGAIIGAASVWISLQLRKVIEQRMIRVSQ